MAIQYLQYPKIAQDFANYLELFYRYREDYRIDDILSGKIPEGILTRLRYAPFDERLQIVSLLLSRLGGSFRGSAARDTEVAHLYGFLKNWKERTDAAPGQETVDASMQAAVFEELLEELREEFRSRVEAGQNEKELKEEYRGVLRTLEDWLRDIRSTDRDAWDLLRERFAAEREALEAQTQETGELLEYAFDFMETAFGESQEMVFFITELSANESAMWFIGENECPRYYRYNKALLFEGADAQVRKQLDEIRTEMTGAGDLYRR